eukprot:TRINITY_DN9642_c0_g2_i1.p2 TRINITY_DN9642_c0_g2~~TRINITY_DN9642_c0_g2_i1.p2  ORF type:complete len:162 (-),score=31.32 TRINITY_DN9642_c0_g2_i1:68-553(-)
MKSLATMSMNSVRKKLNAEERDFCFEIFGYDFIVDEEFRVWLIEINTNPCLEESSSLLKRVLPRMVGKRDVTVDDALKLTVDQVFPRRRKFDNFTTEPTIYRVDGYSNYENMWEYLHQIGIVKVSNSDYKTAFRISQDGPQSLLHDKMSSKQLNKIRECAV